MAFVRSRDLLGSDKMRDDRIFVQINKIKIKRVDGIINAEMETLQDIRARLEKLEREMGMLPLNLCQPNNNYARSK